MLDSRHRGVFGEGGLLTKAESVCRTLVGVIKVKTRSHTQEAEFQMTPLVARPAPSPPPRSLSLAEMQLIPIECAKCAAIE